MYKTSRSFYSFYTQYEREFFNARDVFMCVQLKNNTDIWREPEQKKSNLNSEATFL